MASPLPVPVHSVLPAAERGRAGSGAVHGRPLHCVMNCHVLHAAAEALRCRSCISFLRRVPSRSMPSAPPPAGFPERRDSFCARILPAPPRGRAGVGAGAVRAPDCARETADARLESPPAGAFFGPSHCFPLQKSEKAAPGSRLSATIVAHFPIGQAPGRRNMKIFPIFSRIQTLPGKGRRFSRNGSRSKPGLQPPQAGRMGPPVTVVRRKRRSSLRG